MNAWKEAGGGMFCTFSSMSRSSKWGNWGLLEYADDDPRQAPKYQAVLEFIAKNPAR